MSDIIVRPSELIGRVTPPSSKSAAHRAAICAALCKGTSRLHNAGSSQDITATLDCLRALGANITQSPDGSLAVSAGKPPESATLNCRESGSTLRFLLPVAAALGVEATFTGEGKLPERPYNDLVSALSGRGITFSRQSGLPMTVSGKLVPGSYALPGSLSSQFLTGLLLALPLLDGKSTVTVEGRQQSQPYVEMTLETLELFGAGVKRSGGTFETYGGGYKPAEVQIESDYSGAAFFLAAGALCGDVTVDNLRPDSAQGDRALVDILKRMGADITLEGRSVRVRRSALRAIDIDVSDIPDLAPILGVLLAYSEGTGSLTGAERLKYKESDRLTGIYRNLAELGAQAELGDGSITIRGSKSLTGGFANGYGDHRMVMSAAIAACRAQEPVRISDSGAVAKSYPDFFDHLRQIGGKADVLTHG